MRPLYPCFLNSVTLKIKTFFGVILLLLSAGNLRATHLRAAEINVKRVGCNSLTYEITLVVYTNYENNNITVGGDGSFLFFGDGLSHEIPEITNFEIVDTESKVGRVTYKVTHTYSVAGKYVVAYKESNRNGGILNIESSVTNPFYTETSFTVLQGVCSESPKLTIAPIDRACKGSAFYHNPGAVDSNDDSLSFELVTPLRDANTAVTNYALPTHQKFYTGVYNQSNEEQNGPPELKIQTDGTVVWNAPGASGEYAIALKVREWRYNSTDSVWIEIGYVIRDMQIIVSGCTNKKPQLDIPAEICVAAGTLVQFTGLASDPNHDQVFIEAFSEVFSLSESPAQVTPANGILQSTAPPNDTASIKFTWQTTCEHVKDQPYQVVFKITDKPAVGAKLIQFKTVFIKVVAPAPVLETVSINPVSKTVTLKWEDYPCDNVNEFQIWRRVSKINYTQPDCNIGMPYFLRYQLIAVVPRSITSFADNELAIGAMYCYRIVALVGEDKTPSHISLDTCFIPKPAEAPVITNVSVVTTNASSGTVNLKWTSPFDIDQTQYPPPYQYKVAEGEENGSQVNYKVITPLPISNTEFTTSASNTSVKLYYKIILYVPSLTTSPVDTSSSASTVFLKATSASQTIELSWQGNTPWSNHVPEYPFHLIFRSENPDNGFDLIDSVDVMENDFFYVDEGKYQDKGLSNETIYYYKVLTRGSYGNPAIPSPLENFSNVAFAEVLDIVPPCRPVVTIANTDCSSVKCGSNVYSNLLTWTTSDSGCAIDVVSFQIEVQNNEGEEFNLLGIINSDSFSHQNINSMAKCYRVYAIDDAGNYSEPSETVCNDNCPYFSLTNVLSPGLPDNLNDEFTSYEDAASNDCSRFVKEVRIKIYDRWGKMIYSTVANSDPSVTYWDGKTKSGIEASSGIYYYTANVVFDVRDPEKSEQQVKGWVHLIR